MSAAPAFQFFSPEAADAKWLVWGKILWKKGTRGTRYPDPDVRVQITETAIRVSRQPLTYWYSGLIAAPCQCRALSIVVVSSNAQQTITFVDHGQTLSGPLGDGSWGIAERIITYTSSTVSSDESAVSTFDLYEAHIYLPLGIPSEDPARLPVAEALNAASAASQAAYLAWLQEQQVLLATIKSAQQKTMILLSDGTQLANIPYTDDGVGGKTNYSQGTVWSGDQWIQLFSSLNNGAAWVAGDRVTFEVPPDVCRPALPDTAPTLPTGAAASLPTWAADWAAARATATVRERTRAKTCSDNLKTNLKAGALQDQIKAVLRIGHPLSQGTRQKALMTAVVVNGSTGSGDDITNTKTVTLSYLGVDSSGNPTTLTEIVSGTQHIVITRCANSSGTPNAAAYTTTTYTDWLPITAVTGSTGTALDYTYQLDNQQGLVQIWNGVVVVGAGTIAATFDSLGGTYTPPFLQSSDSRAISYPQLYIDYRAATARIFDAGAGISSWCDSAFKNGEQITIFPLSTIHSELGDLGTFPQDADIGDEEKLTFQVDMKATYAYNYKLGTWVGSGENLKDENGNDTTIALPYDGESNIILRSSATPWPDVASDGTPPTPDSYKGQAADIKAHPEDYPLFVPLLTA